MDWINPKWWYLNLRKLIIGLILLVIGVLAFYYVSGINDYMTGNLLMYQNLMPNLFFFIINTVNIFLIASLRIKIEPFLLVRLKHKSNWSMMEEAMMVFISALNAVIAMLSLLVFIWMTRGINDINLVSTLGSLWLTFQGLLLCQAINLIVIICFPFIHFVMSSCLVGIVLLAGSLRMGSAGLINEITLINEVLAKQSIFVLFSRSLIIWGIILAAMEFYQVVARKREYL
ncbi:hypothetical protein ACLJJ6_09750 [Pediococcus siamensis]|uniref:hypothetical protein n=1 Tax=Pediococcus siamensis TaxID=381829 RepID=UPI0039A2E1DB